MWRFMCLFFLIIGKTFFFSPFVDWIMIAVDGTKISVCSITIWKKVFKKSCSSTKHTEIWVPLHEISVQTTATFDYPLKDYRLVDGRQTLYKTARDGLCPILERSSSHLRNNLLWPKRGCLASRPTVKCFWGVSDTPRICSQILNISLLMKEKCF